jgi:hypothetical protein
MKPTLITLFVLTLLSCADDNPQLFYTKQLEGNWVEIKTKKDTLTFGIPFDDKELMNLKRDVLYRTGPYEYKLMPNNRISIHWLLAATMTFDEYYFKVDGDKLSIGNFYDSPSGPILTFKKID